MQATVCRCLFWFFRDRENKHCAFCAIDRHCAFQLAGQQADEPEPERRLVLQRDSLRHPRAVISNHEGQGLRIFGSNNGDLPLFLLLKCILQAVGDQFVADETEGN